MESKRTQLIVKIFFLISEKEYLHCPTLLEEHSYLAQKQKWRIEDEYSLWLCYWMFSSKVTEKWRSGCRWSTSFIYFLRNVFLYPKEFSLLEKRIVVSTYWWKSSLKNFKDMIVILTMMEVQNFVSLPLKIMCNAHEINYAYFFFRYMIIPISLMVC